MGERVCGREREWERECVGERVCELEKRVRGRERVCGRESEWERE